MASAIKCVTVGVLALVLFASTFVHGSPMMYKKNDQSNYEAGGKEMIKVSHG